ncbi:MAG: hypothetical protein KC418_01300 [Anaerolineales bacterium]|nr:hypothetical protein [Anaerolineales bacterium]MCB8952766.1 cytochrome C [Ardenticatenales bacterium]
MFKNFVGPRIPTNATHTERARYRRPAVLFVVAATVLLVSIFLPYWRMKLLAPQYPRGLEVQVYVNRLTGDVNEIDGLNHYIGMRPLDEAAQLERSISILAIVILVLLVLAAVQIHSKWTVLFTLPALLMPFLFLADMYYWMRNFGLNLDPHAALSSSIGPFVPPILGRGKVGQFETVASFDIGLWLAFLAVVLILVGLYYHRQMYKPLVESVAK